MFSQERIEERARKVGQSVTLTTNLYIHTHIPLFPTLFLIQRMEREKERAMREAEVVRTSQSEPFLPARSLFALQNDYFLKPSCCLPATNQLQSDCKDSVDKTLSWKPSWPDVSGHVAVADLWSPWLMRSQTTGPAGWGNLNMQTYSLFKH